MVPRSATLLAALTLPLAACGIDSGETRDNAEDAAASAGTRLGVDARLEKMGPDGWHRIALYGDWDFIEPEVWHWIVTRPECDRATALAIFWKAQPEYYLRYSGEKEVPASERDSYALLALIRDRWAAGRYTRGELAFDPDSDAWPIDRADLIRRYGDRVERLMPAAMRVRLSGRLVPDEGPPLPGVFRS
jgi:Domain of unknown function (DUF4274)